MNRILTRRGSAMVQTNQLENNSFLAIKTNKDLADYLGIPIKEVTFFALFEKRILFFFRNKEKRPNET